MGNTVLAHPRTADYFRRQATRMGASAQIIAAGVRLIEVPSMPEKLDSGAWAVPILSPHVQAKIVIISPERHVIVVLGPGTVLADLSTGLPEPSVPFYRGGAN